MYIKNRVAALSLRLLTLATGLTAMIIYLSVVRSLRIFWCFSFLSCFFGTLLYFYLSLKTAVDLRYYGKSGVTTLESRLRGTVVVGVLTSVLISLMQLSAGWGTARTMGIPGKGMALSLAAILVNGVMPALMLTDWLLFTRKFKFQWKHVFWWMAYPLVYFLVLLVRGAILSAREAANPYIYYFLDADAMGWGGVLFQLIAVAAAVLVMSLAFILADTAMGVPPISYCWEAEPEEARAK